MTALFPVTLSDVDIFSGLLSATESHFKATLLFIILLYFEYVIKF